MHGGPDWLDVERFDIIAKADEADGEIKPEDRNAMVQTLLEDRFKLQFHIESKEMPVLALAIDKEAPKLQDAKEPGPSAFTTTRSGEMIFKSSSIIGLVNLMANILQTPVVDGTGIKGLYDFSLDPMRFALPPSDRTGDGFDRAQAVVMAVQEQLGLKLEKRRANLDITIIDRAERPVN